MTGFLFDKQGIGIFLRRISRPVKFRRNMSLIEYGVTPILLHSHVSLTQEPVAVNLASTLGLGSFPFYWMENGVLFLALLFPSVVCLTS